MIPTSGLRVDESLLSVIRGLHLGVIALASLVGAWLLFTWLERRGRMRWMRVPVATFLASARPYRGSEVVSEHLARAPRWVRVASFACLAFGHLFVPLILVALVSYPFDGIAVPLIPGLALAVLNWVCAWLLLGRSPNASQAARLVAVGSLMANVGLLAISAAHLVGVELQRRDGIEHACSTSVTLVVIVFAASSVALAIVMLRALRSCSRELDWSEPTSGSARVATRPSVLGAHVVEHLDADDDAPLGGAEVLVEADTGA